MRNAISRLTKLEAKCAPNAASRYYVFGHNEQDAAERVAVETRSGRIGNGAQWLAPIWSGDGPLPAPRWATPEQLTDQELHGATTHLALLNGRQPLLHDAGSDAIASELAAIRPDSAASSGVLAQCTG